MSTVVAAARRQSPDTLERYWTWPWQTRALFAHCAVPRDLRIVEPCAGAGWMVDVLAEHVGRENVSAFDLDPAREDIVQADTLAPGFFDQIAVAHRGAALGVITNPPFSKLADYQRRGQIFGFVALLGRITWLEPTRDREDCACPDFVIVLPRAPFGGPNAKASSDSATAAWFVWGCLERGIARVKRSEAAALKSCVREGT